ncbi:uncharacterized protein LOC127086201 isoform X2 [Lathyrus oleraceus]|uniref:uncharacterized protein LOC127086201 isoform X2 n=1 Tax=Pisum sativum TaxID=3888 RepID=UPI0021CF0572|nr:uncharacterized protein LOC127086201 isoform X2 [Pisum sativum]
MSQEQTRQMIYKKDTITLRRVCIDSPLLVKFIGFSMAPPIMPRSLTEWILSMTYSWNATSLEPVPCNRSLDVCLYCSCNNCFSPRTLPLKFLHPASCVQPQNQGVSQAFCYHCKPDKQLLSVQNELQLGFAEGFGAKYTTSGIMHFITKKLFAVLIVDDVSLRENRYLMQPTASSAKYSPSAQNWELKSTECLLKSTDSMLGYKTAAPTTKARTAKVKQTLPSWP